MNPNNYPFSDDNDVAAGERAALNGEALDDKQHRDWQRGYEQATEAFAQGLFCRECGKPMTIVDEALSHHTLEGAIDYEADAHHVAIHDHKG